MNQQSARRPFVVPRLQAQASLAGVTLISGGNGGPTGGQAARRGGSNSNLASRQGSNNRNA